MATNTAVPFWDEGNTITCHASAAVTGKRFVTISGARVEGNPRVAHAAGTSTTKALGVSGYDTPSGGKVSVYAAPGLVMPVTQAAGVAATAGQLAYSDATGAATNVATGLVVGTYLDDVAAGGEAVIRLA